MWRKHLQEEHESALHRCSSCWVNCVRYGPFQTELPRRYQIHVIFRLSSSGFWTLSVPCAIVRAMIDLTAPSCFPDWVQNNRSITHTIHFQERFSW
jgi:hypothetical protein